MLLCEYNPPLPFKTGQHCCFCVGIIHPLPFKIGQHCCFCVGIIHPFFSKWSALLLLCGYNPPLPFKLAQHCCFCASIIHPARSQSHRPQDILQRVPVPSYHISTSVWMPPPPSRPTPLILSVSNLIPVRTSRTVIQPLQRLQDAAARLTGKSQKHQHHKSTGRTPLPTH